MDVVQSMCTAVFDGTLYSCIAVCVRGSLSETAPQGSGWFLEAISSEFWSIYDPES